MKIAFCSYALLWFSLISQAANGQTALPTGVTKVTSVEGITEYQLDNGLHFLIFPDASKAVITVNMTYLVGSRHEGIRRGRHGPPAGAYGV